MCVTGKYKTALGDAILNFAFQEYFFDILEVRDEAGRQNLGCVQISELRLFDRYGVVLQPNAYSGMPGANWSRNEDISKAFDGDTVSKWCDTSKIGGFTFAFSVPDEIASYELVTGNDRSSRDPVSWSPSGRPDLDSEWSNLHLIQGNAVGVPTNRNSHVGLFIVGTAACDTCPYDSSSPVGSLNVTACTCNAGSSGPDGGTCTKCFAGTYKVGSGSASCDDCPTNSNSPSGSSSLTACMCNAGSFGSFGSFGSSCVWTNRNPADKWCNENNSDNCNLSESDHSGWELDIYGDGFCFCVMNADECKEQCIAMGYCHEIYMTQNGCCFPSKKRCTGPKCPGGCGGASGKYMLQCTENPNVCTICPLGKTSVPGITFSTECAVGCSAGVFGQVGGPCTACVVGTYKSANGSQGCYVSRLAGQVFT